MRVERSDDGDKTLLSIEGTLDAESASPELGRVINDLVSEQRQTVVLELSGMPTIDEYGVGVIVSLFKRIRAYGGHVDVVGLQDQPYAAFRLRRLDRVYPGLSRSIPM